LKSERQTEIPDQALPYVQCIIEALSQLINARINLHTKRIDVGIKLIADRIDASVKHTNFCPHLAAQRGDLGAQRAVVFAHTLGELTQFAA
jgi:hypothetical protein